MTNFDFLLLNPQFSPFASVAINAERVYGIDKEASVLNCRRAMEFAIKWMYSVDASLEMPYQDSLVTLMNTADFRRLVHDVLWKRMDFIRRVGNNAAHKHKKVKDEQAALCLENLFTFLDYVDCCYSQNHSPKTYNPALLGAQVAPLPTQSTPEELNLQALVEENKALKAELTRRREEQEKRYVEKPLELSEYETRKIYIDAMLMDANWLEGHNWLNEVRIEEMPNKAGHGFCDYVLYDDRLQPLAIVEAKRTCVHVEKGRQQAKLYADYLEKKFGRRPVIFLSNGFETRIIDGQYPERKVATIYSKRDLEKLFNLRSFKTSLHDVTINKTITERYYQESAIKAVCETLDVKNKRKALLVMATGSGKTRTVMSLCDVLLRHGWVKNVLFLADRTSLVIQARRSFVNLLPSFSTANICESKPDYLAHGIFSTYQTMMHCIDDARDAEGKIFTPGHFDLLICDEAHRSIYNKYKDIFNYFDAPLVGLTATPKDEIDRNTYEIFELEDGVPTYGYDLATAVDDGYLVSYLSIESQVKYLQQGIVYDELSDEERRIYEDTFTDEEGQLPQEIGASALNSWLFNADTIRKVLDYVMQNALYVDYGQKIGKTIIFAKNHKHAEKIFEIFNQEYPHLNNYAKVIDNYQNYAQSAIDEFSVADKMPQIAISVDMLDTGIDVPEVLNLVFFKTVKSKAKFWQMIGRGTRLAPGLMDGKDKELFYIFDFCGNFEFFRMNEGGMASASTSLQASLFNLKTLLVWKLQDLAHQNEELQAFRAGLVQELLSKVCELNRENFSVKQHLKWVDMYSQEGAYTALVYQDTLHMAAELAPLILPDKDEASALRFDALLYALELAFVEDKSRTRLLRDVQRLAAKLAKVANIPAISQEEALIKQILEGNILENAEVKDFEYIRLRIRDLIKYIPKVDVRYDTNFTDDILSSDWNEAELVSGDLQNYRAKAEYYLRKHVDNAVITKLKSNEPLTAQDVRALEEIFWSEIGTEEEYRETYGDAALGVFVRKMVGLDKDAVNKAFEAYLAGVNLTSQQIDFVKRIVDYISINGLMEDFKVLQESPFAEVGSVSEVFDDVSVWGRIKDIIKGINGNAVAA